MSINAFENKNKRLSEVISINEELEHLEDVVWDENIIIDAGFYFEIYINSDGVYGDEDGEHSSNGYSMFRYIDKEISFGSFLNLTMFSEGSFRDSTMTIRVIPAYDKLYQAERDICLELYVA